jgi:hypothetical protein
MLTEMVQGKLTESNSGGRLGSGEIASTSVGTARLRVSNTSREDVTNAIAD